MQNIYSVSFDTRYASSFSSSHDVITYFNSTSLINDVKGDLLNYIQSCINCGSWHGIFSIYYQLANRSTTSNTN